ncbi:hypothetical protein T07_11465 [Trichinella nelsoni]|uniref:Uncharacterized protein n=1 Tax=Trichinella nelsoni TaxID=6336 RepID=A0A0V0SJD7_9BILA|nr:hypothetical protein T07_11465 [Trichinella nelsoni]
MATRSSSSIFLPKPHCIVPCVNRIPYNLRIKYSLLPIDARSWSRCSDCHISRAVSSCARWISWSSSTVRHTAAIALHSFRLQSSGTGQGFGWLTKSRKPSLISRTFIFSFRS